MMGQQSGSQDRLFYSFNLEAHVPADHLLRGINRFLDLSELRRHLAPFYSHAGRPSIDPELMLRMLMVGYCFGIRSERRLCEEVHLNLAYRWFCRLGLEDVVPDHSTFSKNRHGRFRESEAFRHVFETVLQRCMAEGLVGGEGFAVDASVVRLMRTAPTVSGEEFPYGDLDPERGTRAVREYLEALDEAGEMSARKSVSLTDPAASRRRSRRSCLHSPRGRCIGSAFQRLFRCTDELLSTGTPLGAARARIYRGPKLRHSMARGMRRPSESPTSP